MQHPRTQLTAYIAQAVQYHSHTSQQHSGPAHSSPTKLQPHRQVILGVGGGSAGNGCCAWYRPHQSPVAAPHRSLTNAASGWASGGYALRGVRPPVESFADACLLGRPVLLAALLLLLLLLPPLVPPPPLTAVLPSSVFRRLD